MSDGTWLVVGLGNPGPRYEGTRHNIGQVVVDALARGERFSSSRHQAQVVETRLGAAPGGAPGPRVVLAKPTTYMNVSGGPVAGLARYHKVEPDHVVVVHDELDLDLGRLKLKIGGGEGGHNGLRSVSQSLGTRDYVRVRCGIGRPPGRQDPADFVLSGFAKKEQPEVELLVVDAADAVEMVLTEGLAAAQGRFHTAT
ncbi:aminoacyl-tRNA hydrolase [Aquipuribacter nitratireducens]|uniref:Peptidyl-tRNA hydrolase n=1 Tax=Aquipuribacter nitratireducens TaxID=650104 RepID=A0ABW0GSU3_9MICO